MHEAENYACDEKPQLGSHNMRITSNEKKISHGRVVWQTGSSCVAMGAVGFIAWLGASAATMNDVMQQPDRAFDRVDPLHPRSKAKG